jgi:hypothetical protein
MVERETTILASFDTVGIVTHQALRGKNAPTAIKRRLALGARDVADSDGCASELCFPLGPLYAQCMADVNEGFLGFHPIRPVVIDLAAEGASG